MSLSECHLFPRKIDDIFCDLYDIYILTKLYSTCNKLIDKVR